MAFCNSEKNKLKTRDQLVVREELDNGMYRLDRIHKNSGRVTKAFIRGRDLYKPTTFDEDLIAESIEESQNLTQNIPLLITSAREKNWTGKLAYQPNFYLIKNE